MRRADATAPRPSLIILDLHLPLRGGLEVLADLKNDPDFMTIPIVVLTNSRDPADVEQCYALHANAYLIKPGDFDGFAEVIQQVTRLFLSLFTLPPP